MQPQPRITGAMDGTVVLVNAGPIQEEDGSISGAVSVGQDYTERRRLEHLQDAFLSLVAHELKTPLTVIKGNSQLLLRRQARGQLELGDGDAQTLRLIEEKTNYLGGLVNELLDLSRMESGQLELHPESMDLAALL